MASYFTVATIELPPFYASSIDLPTIRTVRLPGVIQLLLSRRTSVFIPWNPLSAAVAGTGVVYVRLHIDRRFFITLDEVHINDCRQFCTFQCT